MTPDQSEPEGKTAHTPGPWRFQREDVIDTEHLRYPLHTIWTGESWLLARTCFAPASAANARLIAAAPDLLAALKRAVDTIRAFHAIGLNGRREVDAWRLYQQSPEMQAINAALAKAEAQS